MKMAVSSVQIAASRSRSAPGLRSELCIGRKADLPKRRRSIKGAHIRGIVLADGRFRCVDAEQVACKNRHGETVVRRSCANPAVKDLAMGGRGNPRRGTYHGGRAVFTSCLRQGNRRTGMGLGRKASATRLPSARGRFRDLMVHWGKPLPKWLCDSSPAQPARGCRRSIAGQARHCVNFKKWSGRQDSNLRPSAPKADALPGCATPRLDQALRFSAIFAQALRCLRGGVGSNEVGDGGRMPQTAWK